MPCNPLIFIPSPRDIPEFIASTKLLTKYDKYWVKYRPEPDAYGMARAVFLDDDYTHFVILPDDLIVTQQQIDLLIEDINQEDYPIISGITNVDTREVNAGKYCVSKEFPALVNLTEDSYHWFEDWERERYLRNNIPIVQMKHIGFPLTFIRRDIIERFPFKPLPNYSCCIDVQFCIDCYDLSIPIFVDLRIVGKHLKKRDGVYEYFGLATKNPITIFEQGQT